MQEGKCDLASSELDFLLQLCGSSNAIIGQYQTIYENMSSHLCQDMTSLLVGNFMKTVFRKN